MPKMDRQIACVSFFANVSRCPMICSLPIRFGTRTRSSTSCTSRPFRTAPGDGMGDFRGLIDKLDYLQELGVTAIWLLPFYPSPLRDDGYDIADYYDVNPNYGTLDDFQAFLAAAHERGLRVITELVINHTSDQNPWFQKSRRAMAARNAVGARDSTTAWQSQRRPGSTPPAQSGR